MLIIKIISHLFCGSFGGDIGPISAMILPFPTSKGDIETTPKMKKDEERLSYTFQPQSCAPKGTPSIIDGIWSYCRSFVVPSTSKSFSYFMSGTSLHSIFCACEPYRGWIRLRVVLLGSFRIAWFFFSQNGNIYAGQVEFIFGLLPTKQETYTRWHILEKKEEMYKKR